MGGMGGQGLTSGSIGRHWRIKPSLSVHGRHVRKKPYPLAHNSPKLILTLKEKTNQFLTTIFLASVNFQSHFLVFLWEVRLVLSCDA